jgi:hypothetical protein
MVTASPELLAKHCHKHRVALPIMLTHMHLEALEEFGQAMKGMIHESRLPDWL